MKSVDVPDSKSGGEIRAGSSPAAGTKIKLKEGLMLKKLQSFLMTTMNGMTYGLFATLIVGVIIDQLGKLSGIPFLTNPIYITLGSLMGAGIGLGIGLSLKLDGLKLVTAGIIGGIATSFRVNFTSGIQVATNAYKNGAVFPVFNEPLTVYAVVVSSLILMRYILKKKTPIDILLIPLTSVFLAIFFTLLYSAPIGFIINAIAIFIEGATTIAPLPMTIIISMAMGILLTSPLSSAAIAITIRLGLNPASLDPTSALGIAGGAAFVGTSIQMIGFAIQSRKDNSIGMVLSIGFGTSMLQFKNILRKPIIWLPTILASGIAAPIIVLLLQTKTTFTGAGMGTSGLVGPLQTLFAMDYSLNAFLSIILTVVLGGILVYTIDLVLRKQGKILDGDFAISLDIV
jgi:uncharacterized protein